MFKKIDTSPSMFVFTPKARDMCRSCKRYGKKACCPPRVESLEYYKTTIKEYRYARIILKEYIIDTYESESEAGRLSSIELQDELLSSRDKLLKSGSIFVTCFGGGSCKLCETCSKICRHPEKSLVPLEAAGIDVFATLKLLGVELPKVITTSFYRVGAIFYD